MVEVKDPDIIGIELFRILKSLLGLNGFNVLGTYRVVDASSGAELATEPAIAFQWRNKDPRIIRRIEQGSGIECVILGEVPSNHQRMRFGATQLRDRWQIRLDQYDPEKSLTYAIRVIYSHPRIAPLNNDVPQVRDRMQNPEGGVQPARAILTSTLADYQPALF